MSNISRGIFDAELPDGSAWDVKEDGGLDQLIDGLSDNNEIAREFVSNLSNIRNAQKTDILDDLEREYGIVKNSSLTEQERRDALQAIQTEGKNDGSSSYLQARLRDAGFDVYCHINDPAVDPNLFLLQTYLTICGDPTSVCGASEAVCGSLLDELILNGNLYLNDSSLIPTDSGYWNGINFVGGVATRDGVTGELTAIARASVPRERRDELIRLIVKYKPIYSWIGLVVQYT